jgi:RNA polymerase sigma factor (sigma-70 family)
MTTLSMANPGFGVIARRDSGSARDYVRLAGVASSAAGSAHRSFDDETLGTLIAESDSRALEELFDRHGSACYGLARRIVADEQLAHDVVQDVFLAIWKGSASYDRDRGSLTTWLFALTHHKSVDAVRRAQRHSGRRAPEEALETETDLAPGVEEQAIDSVRRDKVRSALAGLPEPQREALLLAYFGGYTQSEIATMTNTPLGTVKTRTLAALRRLRTVLGDAQFPATFGEGGA